MAENNDDATLLEDAGRPLYHLGRILGRPGDRQRSIAQSGRAVELSRIMVVQAVEAAKEADPDAEIGVGTVAAHLTIDPSTASRLVADTLADGYLVSSPSPADARRRRLDLTPAGVALAADARRHQHATFAAAMRDWPAAEQQRFARRFIDFAAAIVAARDAQEREGR
jgi:DNA-binding MarR family transcriptional regulator